MLLARLEPNFRRCLSCRRVAHRSEFWRIVRTHPSHAVQLDQGMGRSAYLCHQASCLQMAQRKDRLGRALKVAIPEDLYKTLWERLAKIEKCEEAKNSLNSPNHVQSEQFTPKEE